MGYFPHITFYNNGSVRQTHVYEDTTFYGSDTAIVWGTFDLLVEYYYLRFQEINLFFSVPHSDGPGVLIEGNTVFFTYKFLDNDNYILLDLVGPGVEGLDKIELNKITT